jgi:hypothetical protein
MSSMIRSQTATPGKIAIRSEFLGSLSVFPPGRIAVTDAHKVGCALDLDFRYPHR